MGRGHERGSTLVDFLGTIQPSTNNFSSLHRPASWAGNCAGSPVSVSLVYTILYVVYTLYRKSDLCILRNETAQPRSQFLKSYICERFIYSLDWSYMNVEIGRQNIIILFWKWRGRAISFLGIHKSESDICIEFSPALHLQCSQQVFGVSTVSEHGW
jgi:hypothetical protein